MKVTWVRGARTRKGLRLTPFYVIGDVEVVIAHLLETSEGLKEDGFVRADFVLEDAESVHLDPGGMEMMEENRFFEVNGVKFRVKPHKVCYFHGFLSNPEKRERVPGYARIGQGPGSFPYHIYIPMDMVEPLSCTLLGIGAEDEVMEANKKARDGLDRAFQQGHLARPDGKGGFIMNPKEPKDPEYGQGEYGDIEPF
jgi:hypothetical protein